MPIFLIAATIFTFLLCVLFSSIWYERIHLPYSELGRYYDGQVVWHEQAVGVYGLISIMFFVLTLVLTYFLVKKLKYENT